MIINYDPKNFIVQATGRQFQMVADWWQILVMEIGSINQPKIEFIKAYLHVQFQSLISQ